MGGARETGVQNQNHPSLHTKFSARLGYRRPCLRKQESLEGNLVDRQFLVHTLVKLSLIPRARVKS